MKRNGHPLRKKVSRGEFKLKNPTDIPDWESKLENLNPDERDFYKEFLKPYSLKK